MPTCIVPRAILDDLLERCGATSLPMSAARPHEDIPDGRAAFRAVDVCSARPRSSSCSPNFSARPERSLEHPAVALRRRAASARALVERCRPSFSNARNCSRCTAAPKQASWAWSDVSRKLSGCSASCRQGRRRGDVSRCRGLWRTRDHQRLSKALPGFSATSLATSAVWSKRDGACLLEDCAAAACARSCLPSSVVDLAVLPRSPRWAQGIPDSVAAGGAGRRSSRAAADRSGGEVLNQVLAAAGARAELMRDLRRT